MNWHKLAAQDSFMGYYKRVDKEVKTMSQYKFRVNTPQTGSYVEVYHNTEQYWKTVSEAQEIVKARVPSGATVEYIGY